MSLGKNIKILRTARGWETKDLAKRSGVRLGTISAIEVRESKRSEYAGALAKALGVSTDDLVSGTFNAKGQLITADQTNAATYANPGSTPAPVLQTPTPATFPSRKTPPTLSQCVEGLALHLNLIAPANREAAKSLLSALVATPSLHGNIAASIEQLCGTDPANTAAA